MIRNLYFFIYPLKPSVWRRSVHRLLYYWPVFNGKKVVAIATDEKTEGPDVVKKEFSKTEVQYFTVRNNPNLGEMVSFVDGLSRMESLRADEATFYSHAKGQKWDGEKVVPIMRWTDAMFFMNLECPVLTDTILSKYKAMGCFRICGGLIGGSQWHYSGSFYWLRHDCLFSQNWRDAEKSFYGTEGYPGKMFPAGGETFELTPVYHPWQLYSVPPDESICRKWLKDLVEEHVSSKGLTNWTSESPRLQP